MKLSIIIPIYNTEKYLKRCLTSIIEQADDRCEIVMVDDGSDDHGLETARQFEEKYIDLIRVFCQEHQGLSAARNLALKEARGEFVLFVDSDDYIEPGALETIFTEISREDSDLILFDTNVRSETGIIMKCMKSYDSSFYTGNLVQYPALLLANAAAWNKVYRKKNL